MSERTRGIPFRFRMTVTLPAALIGLVQDVIIILTLTYWLPVWKLKFLDWAVGRKTWVIDNQKQKVVDDE